jgi:hypothetical protein
MTMMTMMHVTFTPFESGSVKNSDFPDFVLWIWLKLQWTIVTTMTPEIY